MRRFFSDPERSTEACLLLGPEDARHALTVLRMKPGQQIELFHSGRIWKAEIDDVSGHDVRVRIVSPLPSTEPDLAVTLFQGIPKSDRMDLVVQKATELGVSRIVPVVMNRCVVRPDPADFGRRLNRWEKIVREAGKQCGRCIIPEISEPVSLRELPSMPVLPGVNVVPWEEASGYGPLSFRSDHPDLESLGILIGPEGGIENEEIDFLRSAGFIPITLGKRILRTETAGPAAIASFMSLYGEME